MRTFDPEVSSYLLAQRVGVLAVEMPDGSPHGATVHFAHTDDTGAFFFATAVTTLKAKALEGKQVTRATFVLGTNEEDMKTLQLDGTVVVVPQDDMEKFTTVYLGKFPEKEPRVNSPQSLLLKFTPTWWRYTDGSRKKERLVLVSE
ncbi:MAG TPA: pyridoxamine 5'-phosphate oxidase family protein [Candidatus Paceibacterota bacterium]|nr:pyridoxamine 5'-phosphate oxidase family protein [Candidatus Paceibacterota bacterium]